MKYNKKILWDFINNKEIPQNIKDYNFYIEAINITNDESLYYKCPQEVQNNYIFAIYLIKKFKDNKKFINDVAQNYLKSTEETDYRYQELIFIMSDLINNPKDYYYYFYQIKKDMIYTSKRLSIEELLSKESSEDYGLGFIIVLQNENSKVLIDYFATKYIEEIFYDIVRYDLEDIIHMTYKDRFDFVTYGIDNFIIEFIAVFDGYLAYYIKNNTNLIKDIHKYIKSLAKNWNKYIKINYGNKINELEEQIKDIMKKYNSSLTINEIYTYIDKKSLLLPIRLSNNLDDTEYILSNKKIKIEDLKCLKESLDAAEDIFMCKEENNEDNKKYKGKILEFKLNKK